MSRSSVSSSFEDVDLGDGKRWVTVGPAGGNGARLLLAQATDEAELARIGDQTGGRVFLFLETDDFARDHAAMLAAASSSARRRAMRPTVSVAVFADLYGNLWDLIEPRR